MDEFTCILVHAEQGDATAAALGMPQRSAERLWTFARAWLRGAMK